MLRGTDVARPVSVCVWPHYQAATNMTALLVRESLDLGHGQSQLQHLHTLTGGLSHKHLTHTVYHTQTCMLCSHTHTHDKLFYVGSNVQDYHGNYCVPTVTRLCGRGGALMVAMVIDGGMSCFLQMKMVLGQADIIPCYHSDQIGWAVILSYDSNMPVR